jgi:hypothetical protein
MPLTYQPIPEITTHVLDPIVEQLIFRILKRCNLLDLFKENIFIKAGYHAVSDTTDINNATLLQRNLFKCDVAYQMNPLNTKWPMVNNEHLTHYGISLYQENRRYPIFYDPHSQLHLFEIGNPKSMQLSCVMTFLDREIAYSTIETITSIYGNGDEIMDTNFIFDFPLPSGIFYPLYHFYTLLNLNMTFAEYLEQYANSNYGNFGLKKNRENTNEEVIIRRNNVYTMYQLEFQDEKPTEDGKDQSIMQYNIPFQVTTQFNCPSKLFLKYPIIINNQEIKQEYIPQGLSSPPAATDGLHTQYAIEGMRPMVEQYININQITQEPKRFPFYDDWSIPLNSQLFNRNYKPFFIASFTLDNNEKTILPIQEVLDEESGIRLREEVIQILLYQQQASFKYMALINLTIFTNNSWFDYNYLRILENGSIEAKCTNPRRFHHLVLSYAPNLSLSSLDTFIDWSKISENSYYDNFFQNVIPGGSNGIINSNGFFINKTWDFSIIPKGASTRK